MRRFLKSRGVEPIAVNITSVPASFLTLLLLTA
jgi:hypothetical protein